MKVQCTLSSFSFELWSGLLRNCLLKVTKAGPSCECSHFHQVWDVANRSGIYISVVRTSVHHGSQANIFLLFVGKDGTNVAVLAY